MSRLKRYILNKVKRIQKAKEFLCIEVTGVLDLKVKISHNQWTSSFHQKVREIVIELIKKVSLSKPCFTAIRWPVNIAQTHQILFSTNQYFLDLEGLKLILHRCQLHHHSITIKNSNPSTRSLIPRARVNVPTILLNLL